jgi:DNA excision repair protein ERCC-3
MDAVLSVPAFRSVVTGPDPDEATDADTDDEGDGDRSLDLERFQSVVQSVGRPVVTASEAARVLGWSQREAADALDALAAAGRAERADVADDPTVWYTTDFAALAGREHAVVFPDRREVVIEHPEQFSRAQLAQFAHLVDRSGEAYLYRVREEDVWHAPYDDLDDLLGTVRDVLGGRYPALESWMESQWGRARKFALVTQDDYTVLEAASADLLGNVALGKLEEGDHYRARIDDARLWVTEGAEGEIKRILYEAGYPVSDERELETGDPLEVELRLELRDYQRDWVDRFGERGAGVFVGPPGSGKTVAALGAMAEIGGETLVLVPSRELADQWAEAITTHTSLDSGQVGQYHGGAKEIRPVTVATYRTAGMDRHHHLFDNRKWGLILFDEVHHVTAPVYRRTAELQSRHRLGLSATPVREDDREQEIFTLIGPPIGTDWAALFDAGFVAEPEVEIRYVPWASEMDRNEYASADGNERQQIAASNPAKLPVVERLLERHAGQKTLIFVDWLDQGRALSEALEVPFVSGETRHAERRRLFDAFRAGERETLLISRVGDEGIDLPDAEVAIVASGLGGSRRQGSQRAGRTMRPVGRALVYMLATRGTVEEEFVRRQTRHLAGKGVRVTETDAGIDVDAER